MSIETFSPVQSVSEAKQIQESLRTQVVIHDQFDIPHIIAGIDVALPQRGSLTRAAVVLLTYPDLILIETAIAEIPTQFPYIPGFLSFREIPAILKAIESLQNQPDLIFCDGQGLAHPRRFGIACHLGVLLDKPTIGVAKSRLIGTHAAVPLEKGEWVPLWKHQERLGAVLRSRTKVKPLYISPGHRISIETAIDYVQKTLTRYRLPEPTRLADKLSKNPDILLV
jgi:deoxyribonuclease V